MTLLGRRKAVRALPQQHPARCFEDRHARVAFAAQDASPQVIREQ